MASGALLAGLVRPAHRASLLGVVLATWGCGGEVLDLGSSPLEAGGAGATAGTASRAWAVSPTPLLPQQERVLLSNPTLKGDLSELYYSVQVRGSDARVHFKMATGGGSGFGSSTALTGLGEPETFDASSPAVSAEADELWFSQLGATNTEIWHSTRLGVTDWATPTLVTELSSPDGDTAPRPPAVGGTIMPLSSKRHGMSVYYQIYFSERSAVGSAWSQPHQTGLTEINSPDFQSADGFLSNDGLELYFSSTRDGDHTDHDLYVARRGAAGADFGAPQPLVDLNDPVAGKPSEERMPWLSPDGRQLYFASDWTGQYTLYVATKL